MGKHESYLTLPKKKKNKHTSRCEEKIKEESFGSVNTKTKKKKKKKEKQANHEEKCVDENELENHEPTLLETQKHSEKKKKKKSKKRSTKTFSDTEEKETDTEKSGKKHKEKRRHSPDTVEALCSSDSEERSAKKKRKHEEKQKKESKKEETTLPNRVGQWATAELGDSERQKKFYQLLGGMRSSSHASGDTSDNKKPKLPKFNAALNKNQETELSSKLERQFEQARYTTLNARGQGLGFGCSKSNGIDTSVRSKKFDDD